MSIATRDALVKLARCRALLEGAPYAVLALPFLIGAVLLQGFRSDFPLMGSADEALFHHPTVSAFAREWPHLDLVQYHSATTPLSHVLGAAAERALSLGLPGLRAQNALFAFGATALLYRLLVRELAARRVYALLIALLFAVSPYVLGYAFTVATENLTYLLTIGALGLLLRAQRTGSMAHLAGAAGCVSLALLTRQTAVWMLLPAGLVVLTAPLRPAQRALGIAAFAAALAPMVALFVAWHGLVPPACSAHQHLQPPTKPLALALAVLGFYALWVQPVRAFVLGARLRAIEVAAALVVGVALQLPAPLIGASVIEVRAHGAGAFTDGILIKLAERLPAAHGVALLFLVLIAAGALALARQIRFGDARARVAIASFVGVALTAIPNAVLYQRYIDVVALLCVVILVARGAAPRRRDQLVVGALALTFSLFPLLRNVIVGSGG